MAKNIDFSNFQGGTPVFLTMYRNKKYRETQNVTFQKITKPIDFTRLKDTFEEKIMFSYMVQRETIKCSILAIHITIDFTDI